MKTLKSKIERSPRGLVTALFDSLDGLNNGTESVEDVRAVCQISKSIVNVARLEMDAIRLSTEMGRRLDITTLPGIGGNATSKG